MTTITTIQSTDVIANSRTDINTNFANLNSDKIETSVIDTDTTLAANSDSKIPSQKAVKDYVLATASPTGKSWNEYAVDAVGTDSYAITVAGVTAYVAGQTFKFKAGTANTGACSLNVNGLGAITIKKDVNVDLSTGDILANQVVVVCYDGTYMQFISKSGNSSTTVQIFTSNGTFTVPSGATKFLVELLGAGGSGGVYTAATGNVFYAHGGAGGEYHSAMFVMPESALGFSTIGKTFNVVIGQGGASVSKTGGATGGTAGNGGGDTTFGGTLLVAKGGAGGIVYSTAQAAAAGGDSGGRTAEKSTPVNQEKGGNGANTTSGGIAGESGKYTAGGGSIALASGGTSAGAGTATITGYAGSTYSSSASADAGIGCGSGGVCVVPTGNVISGKGGDGKAIITIFYN